MRKHLPSLTFFLMVLVVWEFIVRFLHIEKYLLPAPSGILGALRNTAPLLWEHSRHTVAEALLGFALAVGGGLLLAVLMGLIPRLKRMLYPLVVVSQTVPIIALAPLLIIWFGYGMLPKVVVVALVCFFPITVSLVEGLGTIESDMIRLLLVMGASRWQIFWKAQFPGALPAFFAGMKIAATYSIMGAVIGEWLGASAGLGIYMTRSMHSFLTEQVFAAIVVISVLSILLFGLTEAVGRLVMPWYYRRTP